MKTRGIRILDKKNRIVNVELSDIFEEIYDGDLLNWSILHLYTTGHLGEGRSIPEFEGQIAAAENGVFITWIDLNILSNKLWDIMDITLIGCKEKNLLRRFPTDQEMYEKCDIVIEKIDSSYWEVFSKDQDLIKRLAAKFKEIKFLEPDFER